MATALERLRDMNRADVVLDASGRNIPVGLKLVPMSDALDLEFIPKAIVARVLASKEDGEELTADEVKAIGDEAANDAGTEQRLRAFCARNVETLFGEPVEMTGEDTKQFSDEEFGQLLSYCTRDTPLPGKD